MMIVDRETVAQEVHQDEAKAAVKKNKAVSFLETVCNIANDVGAVTEEEIDAKWFSNEDYQQFRRREKDMLARIAAAAADTCDDYQHSFGLESKVARRRKRERMIRGHDCVFLEQEWQWEQRKCDEERIATSYHVATKDAAVAARQRAMTLEKELGHQQRRRRGGIIQGSLNQSKRWLTKFGSFRNISQVQESKMRNDPVFSERPNPQLPVRFQQETLHPKWKDSSSMIIWDKT